MPITRTAMVDDDGSGLTGTILNNAWKQELYGQIDGALLLPQPAPFRLGTTSITHAFTGTVNNVAPVGGTGAVVWYLNPTGAAAITGIVAEADLTQHLLVNMTGNAITFHNQHASSAVGNKLIGPGYTTYVLSVWASVWIIYSVAQGSTWILLKA